MKASDIEHLVAVSRPAVHPDGDRAVVAVSHPSLRANRNVGQLWQVDADGSARRSTRGVADGAPAYSPDGTRIAFLRASGDDKAQVFVLDARGGEPVQATDAELGVGEFAWSPDGSRIAFTARVPEPGRYGSVKGLEATAESPRHITTYRYHANGLGYTNDRRSHVFVVDVPDPHDEPAYERAPAPADGDDTKKDRHGLGVAAATRLTVGDRDFHGVAFTPEGTTIVTVTALHEERDVDLVNQIVSVPITKSDPVVVVGTEHRLEIDGAAVTPNGTVVFVAAELGPTGRDFVARDSALYVASGGGVRRLTDPQALDLSETDSTTLGRSDESFLVQVRSRGTRQLARVTLDGAVERLSDGAVEVNSADEGAGVVWASISTPTSFGEVAVVRDGGLRALTELGKALQDKGIMRPDEHVAKGRDGTDTHGWVYTPAGGGPHPVLLSIHGGPYAQYGVHVFDEAQVYVDAGYAVVMCNPRGSAGYGQEHGRAIKERMGTSDLDDVLDFLDHALGEHPTLDPNRVGVMGGSYGGYLTAWTIAHEHRFTAAVVERGFLDPLSFVGTSDIGDFFGDEYVGTDVAQIVRQSPMAVVDQVRTPTLVMHSEQDYRCPLEQATRYYAALKRNGVEAELLIFPGENHELSRSGQPRHRMERFGAILDWWGRKLPVG